MQICSSYWGRRRVYLWIILFSAHGFCSIAVFNLTWRISSVPLNAPLKRHSALLQRKCFDFSFELGPFRCTKAANTFFKYKRYWILLRNSFNCFGVRIGLLDTKWKTSEYLKLIHTFGKHLVNIKKYFQNFTSYFANILVTYVYYRFGCTSFRAIERTPYWNWCVSPSSGYFPYHIILPQ